MSHHHHDHEAGHCCGHHEHAHKEPRGSSVLNADVRVSGETTLTVAGMDCAEEVALLERVLRPVPGVQEMRVNLIAGQITVAHDDSIDAGKLIEAIAPTGLKASLPNEAHEHGDTMDIVKRRRLLSVAIAGVLTGCGLVLQWSGFSGWPEHAIFAMAIVAGGWFIVPKALFALRQLAPDMNLLMLVAVVGAIFIGQWSEGAVVTLLFGLSELLEAFSLQRARRAIGALLKLTPETALVKRGETFVEAPATQVRVDEIITVKSGARIPLDSLITSGASSVNQAPITGESMPVEKKAGDILFAGTINGEGYLEAKVTKAAGDSMLARIIKLVGEAQAQKAPSQRFVDTFARYYTPAVMVAALLVWLLPPLIAGGVWSVWFYRALVLLVIACPCALVISTPVSIVSGLTAMARRGVLIKGGAHLESLGKLRALALDKTGTLTTGQPKVLRVVTLNGKTESEILRIAAAIDTHSGHPLARAVLSAAEEQQVAIARSTSYFERTGRGAEAHLDGHEYFVGNHRFNHELGTCSPEIEKMLGEIERQGQSVVIVGHKPHANCTGEVLGILAIGDPIRPQAKEALRALHRVGIEKVVMLSGDNQNTANTIAKQTGIDEAHGDLLPDDKIKHVRELTAQYHHVGMIGDGVNDAPAMAAATVGIAMGKAGTDTAIETADMTLMQDDLGKVAEAIHLGKRTLRIIQFNIAFALGLKALFLVLALSGHASLWMAIMADTGATLLVILNALRLLRGAEQKKEVGLSSPTPAIS